ncbi:hypothetical protein LIER_41744 [Lithospermum erythrorhizon]|uniref:NAC domain-containing protein n=1 Tax=Lithospermum erythrorhizon TaxID=34254 RepID=A0AAV3RDX6_LITER
MTLLEMIEFGGAAEFGALDDVDILSKNNEKVKKYSCRVQAGCGYWKAIGQDKPIFDSLSQNHHQIVGMKRTSVFCQRKKRPQRIQTWWIMHQFFLVDSIAKPPSTKNLIVQTGEWLVCCIFQQKKRGARKKGIKKQESLIIEGDNHMNNSLDDVDILSKNNENNEVLLEGMNVK